MAVMPSVPGTAAARELYQGLATLAETLHRWDRFEHYATSSTVSETGSKSLQKVAAAAEELQLFVLKPFLNSMEGLLKRIGQVETEAKPNLLGVIDLVSNSQRRISGGRVDDGVARLYRALEATAQVFLHSIGIDTSKVDWTKVPPELHPQLRKDLRLKEGVEPPAKIALVEAFELARALKIPGVEHFFNQQGKFCYEKRLSGRNESILAHGWKTLRQVDAANFVAQLRADLQKLGADFSGWDIPTLPRLWS